MKDRWKRMAPLAMALVGSLDSNSHASAQTMDNNAKEANLATLTVSHPVAPNSIFEIDGTSFAPDRPVDLHFDSVSGAVMGEAMPNKVGTVIFHVRSPESVRGTFAIVATQKDENGTDIFGTPARASVTETEPGQQVIFTRSSTEPTPDLTPDRSGENGDGMPIAIGLTALFTALGAVGFNTYMETSGRKIDLAAIGKRISRLP